LLTLKQPPGQGGNGNNKSKGAKRAIYSGRMGKISLPPVMLIRTCKQGVIPGKRSAPGNPWIFPDSRFRGNDMMVHLD